VGFQACVVEVGSFAAVLTIWDGEGVGVGSFDRQVRLPETSLRLPNRRTGKVLGRVIGGLRYEPREVPSGLLA